MKQILFILILLSGYSNSQVIKDTVLGKPKFVKEYVVFLNDSGPFTFMKGDDEYGHATIMRPDNLRKSMSGSWFGSEFCRYINNETYYDKNRNVTKETWYYKSGEIVDDYDYTYDNLNRLTIKNIKGYSERNYRYFYDGNNGTIKFGEVTYKRKNEPIKKFVNNFENSKPLFITKYDTLSKTDSVFAVTNDIWKKVGERSYTEGKDSIYHKKLCQVKIYNNKYKVIEAQFFDYKLDYENKKIFLTGHFKYEYDELGNLTKSTDIKDGKYHYYTIPVKGKIIEEEKNGDYARTIYTNYTYTKDQKLERKIMFYKDKVWSDIKFEYNGNHIAKLYLNNDESIKPTVIIFRYKFDKQKNWTEIIKNVNGKDLYKWVRQIEYYK